MEYLNKIELQGNVGRCYIHADCGVKYANFSIAVNDTYSDADGNEVIETNWFNCVAFEGANVKEEDLDNLMQLGSPINIKGRLHAKQYKGTDGLYHNTYEVYVSELKIL